MIKFGRNYRLTVELPESRQAEIVIEYPLTIQFTVKRGLGASLNTLDCVIYNLSEQTRADIFQDRFAFFLANRDNTAGRRVVLEAGYGADLAVIFQGNLYEAGSFRQGSNILTSINARDSYDAVQSSFTNKTLQAGTPMRQVFLSLIGDMTGLNVGAVTNTEDTLKRPVTLNGATYEVLKQYAPGDVFIDQESVSIIRNDEAINYSGAIALIDADAGLLETPRRNDSGLTVTTLFEPRVQVGQVIELASTVQPKYNGKYKVGAVTHSCTISGAQGGQCSTTLGLILNGGAFGDFKLVNHETLGDTQRVNLSTPPVAGQ